MTTLSDIEVRQVRDEAIRDVVRRLVQGARNPARIGVRVLQWDYVLNRATTNEKQLSFAKRLGVSEPRVCVAVADAEAAITEIRNAKSGSTAGL